MPMFNGRNWTLADFQPFKYFENWTPFFGDVLTELDARAAGIGDAVASAQASASAAATDRATVAADTATVAADKTATHNDRVGADAAAAAAQVAAASVLPGQPGGICELDGDGKVPTSRLPAAILGALNYQGTWNAATNTPAIPAAASGNKGRYYVVSVAGTTVINGEADWQVGDWIVSSGASWGKVDNTDRVRSVAGRVGDVALTVADLPDLAEFIRDTVAAFMVGGNGVAITHNDAANTLTVDVTGHGLVAGRYWRLLSNGAPYTGAGDYTALFELEMFSASDGSGSDLTTGKTATASSVYSGFPAGRAIDDNASTEWSTAEGAASNAWLSVDFGAAVTVRSLSITPQPGRISGTVFVQYSSDAAAWATLATIAPVNGAGKQVFTYLQ
ncbi:discoidin domain-containing protein [Azospirillum doebereinerae]|uniref:discoidin domain-containing protein n=1 Tax=Azospirillum doebereinerae TaxID=92933 RepID=UPI001EE6037A|nr:discoidin domain-containing protein [Azospirillum doebereinerae]MCG5241862.1 discoidin domain-containing protein [Azospirillum doebereinerae]